MKVKALIDCFVDNGYRKEGEVFDFSGKLIPELMEPLEPVASEQDEASDAPKLRKRGRAAAEVSD